jgi:SAM-dependent methyltransferase
MTQSAHAPFPTDFKSWVSHFDEFSGFYNEALDGSAGLRKLAAMELEAVHSLLGETTTGTVLDLGSGTGRISAAFEQWGFDVTSTDASEAMRTILQERFGREAIHACMGEALPFDDDSFDVVVSIRVLKYVQNWEFALCEMQRVCKPGGVVIVEWTNKASVARFGYNAAPVTLLERSDLDAVLDGGHLGSVPGSRAPHAVWRVARAERLASAMAAGESLFQRGFAKAGQPLLLARSVISAWRK